MAGLPWFEMDVDMPDDPKCQGLGVRLKNPLAFGYVVRLYAYCYRHGTDRFAAEAAPSIIEDACRWRGRTGALFSALSQEKFLDREGEMIVVHGVADRLEPTLAKRSRDRERMAERRANVARTSRERSTNVSGDKDKDKDKDRSGTEITIGSDPPTAFPSTARQPRARRAGGLDEFRGRLGRRLGLGRPVAVGRPFVATVEFFEQQIAEVGEESVLADCAEFAQRERNGVVPGTLSWFVGWLRRLPEPPGARAPGRLLAAPRSPARPPVHVVTSPEVERGSESSLGGRRD